MSSTLREKSSSRPTLSSEEDPNPSRSPLVRSKSTQGPDKKKNKPSPLSDLPDTLNPLAIDSTFIDLPKVPKPKKNKSKHLQSLPLLDITSPNSSSLLEEPHHSTPKSHKRLLGGIRPVRILLNTSSPMADPFSATSSELIETTRFESNFVRIRPNEVRYLTLAPLQEGKEGLSGSIPSSSSTLVSSPDEEMEVLYRLKEGVNFLGRGMLNKEDSKKYHKKVSRRQLELTVSSGLLFMHLSLRQLGLNESVLKRRKEDGFEEKILMKQGVRYDVVPGDVIYLLKDVGPLMIQERPILRSENSNQASEKMISQVNLIVEEAERSSNMISQEVENLKVSLSQIQNDVDQLIEKKEIPNRGDLSNSNHRDFSNLRGSSGISQRLNASAPVGKNDMSPMGNPDLSVLLERQQSLRRLTTVDSPWGKSRLTGHDIRIPFYPNVQLSITREEEYSIRPEVKEKLQRLATLRGMPSSKSKETKEKTGNRASAPALSAQNPTAVKQNFSSSNTSTPQKRRNKNQ